MSQMAGFLTFFSLGVLSSIIAKLGYDGSRKLVDWAREREISRKAYLFEIRVQSRLKPDLVGIKEPETHIWKILEAGTQQDYLERDTLEVTKAERTQEILSIRNKAHILQTNTREYCLSSKEQLSPYSREFTSALSQRFLGKWLSDTSDPVEEAELIDLSNKIEEDAKGSEATYITYREMEKILAQGDESEKEKLRELVANRAGAFKIHNFYEKRRKEEKRRKPKSIAPPVIAKPRIGEEFIVKLVQLLEQEPSIKEVAEVHEYLKIVYIIYSSQEPLHIRAIARKIKVHSLRVSQAVNYLEDMRLVRSRMIYKVTDGFRRLTRGTYPLLTLEELKSRVADFQASTLDQYGSLLPID